MMDGTTWIGIGLTVLGLGMPTTVALLRLLPDNHRTADTNPPCREHETRMGETETDVAVLKSDMAMIKTMLERIEKKLDRRNGST